MGNLIGTNPAQWVKTQVDLRQQLLGLENRDSETLSWITNNTSWIRAVSAVNITSAQKSRELTGSENYQGRELAKNFILYNGVSRIDNDQKLSQPSGIYSGGDIFGSTYGFGGISQGLVPPPGIESLDIKTYNRGSFRKATLKIKANSKQQFDIIEALYMHPGFTLLVEWGHTLYFTHSETDVTSKTFETANFNTTPFKQLLYEERVDQDQILKGIDAERNSSRGNYDGFFGKIVNFKWSFNEDNSYDIDVDVISLGDVIESLTINRIVKVSNPFPEDPKPEIVKGNPPQPNPSAAESATTANREQTSLLNRLKGLSGKLNAYSASKLGLVPNGGYITGMGNDGKTPITSPLWKDFFSSLTSADHKVIYAAGLGVKDSSIEKIPKVTTKTETEAETALETPLITGKNKSQLHTYLYTVYDRLKKNESKGKDVFTYKQSTNPANFKYPTIKVYSESVYKKEDGTYLDPKELLALKPLRIAGRTTSNSNGGSITKHVPVQSKNAPLQYVRLYHILQYIEENLLMYSKDKNGKPLSYVRFDPNWQQTFCFTYPGHFSSDPNVCLVPFKVVDYKKDSTDPNAKAEFGYLVEQEISSCFYEVLETKDDNNFRTSISEYAGKLMFIHVNIHFIVQCLEASTNENGVVLLRFLEQLLNGIQDALGNVNKLTVTFDHDNNLIKFMDDIPLDPKVISLVDKGNFEPNRKTLFNVYGWRPGKSTQFDNSSYLDVTGNPLPGYGNVQNGSFVYSVGLDSGITPQMATMLAIGAQSRGTSDLTNATAFNKFHEGLEDRVIPDKLSKAVLTDVVGENKTTMSPEELKELDDPKTPQQRRQTLKVKYEQTYGKITDPLLIFQENIKTLRSPQGLIDKFYQKGILVDGDIIDISKDISNATTRYIVSLLNDEGGVPPASGFIPFDLNLTMLGLSGIRMYERFYIDQNILPTSYNSNLSFIIKGVDHKVNAKGWETTITSLAAANNATTQTNSNLSLPKTQISQDNPPSAEN